MIENSTVITFLKNRIQESVKNNLDIDINSTVDRLNSSKIAEVLRSLLSSEEISMNNNLFIYIFKDHNAILVDDNFLQILIREDDVVESKKLKISSITEIESSYESNSSELNMWRKKRNIIRFENKYFIELDDVHGYEIRHAYQKKLLSLLERN